MGEIDIRWNGIRISKARVVDGRPVRNTILTRIPAEEFEAIQPHLEFTPFSLAACLQREQETIESVTFLNHGIASMLVETYEGKSVEVGVSGREDMLGLLLATGLETSPHSLIMQVPGEGFQMESTMLKRWLEELPELRRILIRQLGIRWVQFSQNAACNRLHNIRQRLARWLLVTHDRLDSDLVTTTHDFLAKLIGTDRPTVSVALGELEQDGIVERNRGSILIVNREGLELQSCECYGAFRQFNVELGLVRNGEESSFSAVSRREND
jgi:CRP-like cAMP-binding protein